MKLKIKNKEMEAELCDTVFSKGTGLMFARKPRTLIFPFSDEKRRSLHMLFVFFPIDVLFLDKKKKIVEVKKDLRPFSFYTSKSKCSFVIELPSKSIKSMKIKVGDNASF